MESVCSGGESEGRDGYPSCLMSAVVAQLKEWLFLPSLMSMLAVLTVTLIPSGW